MPKNVRYRLAASKAPLSPWTDSAPDDTAISVSEDCSWEYVANRGQFFIFRTELPDARELDTDPQVQAIAINHVYKRERNAAVSCFIMTIIYPFLMIKGDVILAMLSIGTGLFLFGAALLLWTFLKSAATAVHLHKLRRKLANGEPPDHSAPWKNKFAAYRISKAVFIVLVILWTVLFIKNYTGEKNELPLKSFSGELPFSTIKDFVQGEYRLEDFSFSNTIEFKKDPLAPVMIQRDEIAKIITPTGKMFSGGLYISYFEASHQFIAEEITRELLSPKNLFKHHEMISLPSLDTDFVAGYTDPSTGFPTLVLRNGKTVLRAVLYQTGNFELSFAEWASILASSIS